jgi:RNA polymerase sigma-70 factor (family 1)
LIVKDFVSTIVLKCFWAPGSYQNRSISLRNFFLIPVFELNTIIPVHDGCIPFKPKIKRSPHKFKALSNQSVHSDDVLLRLMCDNDQEAFTFLYRHYWEDLFVTAAKVLHGKQEAADVVQDVFLSLWNRRHELKIEGSMAAYLQTSARYKAIHYIEKNITRRDYLALLADVAVNTLPPSPDIQLQLKEVQQAIHDTIARMPPKMQAVYRLSRQEHLSHREIADRLDISAETVKKHIQHALHLIKIALGYTSVSLSLLLFHLAS